MKKKVRLTTISRDEMKKATAGAESAPPSCTCNCQCTCWEMPDGITIGGWVHEFDGNSGSFSQSVPNEPPIG